MKLYMFRTVTLAIIRSFSLYTQQWCISDRSADSLRAGSGCNAVPSWSCSQAVSKPVWHIPFMCAWWKTPDDGQRNCPKHVEFHFKNKFEKLVHLVGFIIRKKKYVLAFHTSHHQAVKQFNIQHVYNKGQLFWIFKLLYCQVMLYTKCQNM